MGQLVYIKFHFALQKWFKAFDSRRSQVRSLGPDQYSGSEKKDFAFALQMTRPCVAQMTTQDSLVILKLDLELIATESPFAPNNYLSDPNPVSYTHLTLPTIYSV